ncbi:RNA polymerase sigma factor [Psychrobacillus sp. FJAT-51614]|uniref:RNA polymerase sigma factor n=1 Tax=Psychrobacillus mangrovi TaxID=3117745 RepID=A0ABU8F6L3_9BACI
MRPLVEKTPIEMNDEFEMAIEPFMLDLKKYCLSLTNTKWDGEDLMQETLVKTYESWLNMPKQISKSYLFRIASNAWIDKHRKRKIEEDMNQDVTNIKLNDEPHTESFIPAINAILNQLTAKQRAVVLFVLGFGYTVKETANYLSASEGSIKAALHRARKNLKRLDYNSLYELEENTIPYIHALKNGNPHAVLRLYQEEIQVPLMQAYTNELKSNSTPMVQSFAGTGTPYVLISIPKKNGGVLLVPFYQLELSTLLSQIAWMEQKELLAVA